MWKHVYRDFDDLSKSEQLALFEAMKQDLFPEERQISCETTIFVQGLR